MQKIWQNLRHIRNEILIRLFVILMASFFLQRMAVCLSTWENFYDCDLSEIITSFIVGTRFDLVAAAMLLAPLSLIFLFIPPSFDRRPVFRSLISMYAGFILALVLFVCIADYFFFLEFGVRLNDNVIQYFHYDYIHEILIHEFYLIPVLIGCLLLFCGLSAFMYKKIFQPPDFSASWTANFIGFLIISALLAVAIRGTLGPKPINTGPAYFSQSSLLPQLTLNGLFTFRDSVWSNIVSNWDIDKFYDDLPTKDKAFNQAKEILQTPKDKFVPRDGNPLWRTTDTGRKRKNYNVVIIVMESVCRSYIEPMSEMPRLTPHLNRLVSHGLLMNNCFSVGTRTTRAFSGLIAGFPDLIGPSITVREASVGKTLTIGSILKKRGYKTLFIYAGQPYYDHRQSFLASNGFTDFVFEKQFPQKTFRNHLGWCDEDLFMAAHKTFTEQTKPFFAVLLTLAFHRDYKIPKGKIQPAYPDHPHACQIQALQYCDWAIGRFFEKARHSDYFDNTIFVITADNCGGFLSLRPEPTGHHIPFLIYAPAIIGEKGKIVTQICSQTDIAPTIMDLLGGKYEHSFFGSSVLSRSDEQGMALLQNTEGVLWLIDGKHYAVRVAPHQETSRLYRFQSPSKLIALKQNNLGYQKIRSDMERKCLSLIQSAYCSYHARGRDLAK